MIDFLKIVLAGIIGGALTLGGSYFLPHQAGNLESLGASVAANVTTVSNPWRFLGGFTWGTNGTSINAIKTGSCTIWDDSTTIAATTTDQVECQGATNGSISAITGITADSICTLTMASSTVTTLAGLDVQGASASSTAGTIVGRLSNLTGTTFTWTAAASSSAQWNYTCIDPT